MPREKLTPASARALEPGNVLRDHEVPGLELRAGATGKRWMLYYRTRAGVERRPRIGAFPEMSLSQAREVAAELKMQVAQGKDPAGDWQHQREAPTVADLCARYLADWTKRKAASSAYQDRRLIEAHILPGLGRARVAEVTREDVDRFLAAVTARKFVTAERKAQDGRAAAPGAANHCRALLSKLFALAAGDYRMGVAINPVRGSLHNPMEKRRRLATPEELPRLAAALDGLAETQPRHAALLWCLFLTGARVSEVWHATADQLEAGPDGRPAAIRLDRHKTWRAIGAKRIPLPPRAAELLGAEQLRPGEKIFDGVAYRKAWARVRREAGCSDLQIRDARRTFASYALSAGYTLDQIGGLFGHTSTETTKGYAWLLEDGKRRTAEAGAAEIERAARPIAGPPSGEA